MSNPLQELVFTFGAINDIYPKEFRDGHYSRKPTCEFAELVFSSFYTEDDSRCYWNQLLRGQVCGCPDNSETNSCLDTTLLGNSLSIRFPHVRHPPETYASLRTRLDKPISMA